MQTKNFIEDFSSWGFHSLENFLGLAPLKVPPVFLFQASWAKGSLKLRTHDEIAWVHRQEALGQGITLISPPAAWISHLDQLPEEIAHLVAVAHRKHESPKTEREALTWMILHEAWGAFGAKLIGDARTMKRRIRPKDEMNTQDRIWQEAHQHGYELGLKLWNKFLREEVTHQDIRGWFSQSWCHRKSLMKLQKLAQR